MTEKPTVTPTYSGSSFITGETVCERLPLTLRELGDYGRSGVIPRIKLSSKKLIYHWPSVEKAVLKMTLNPVSED